MLKIAMLGIPAALAIWLAIGAKWQRGIWMLIAFVPFAGAVSLILKPNPAGALVKDLLFVLPTYFVFLILHMRELRYSRIPSLITLFLIALAAIVLLQTFNPGVSNVIYGAVGIKVWLLYIPLCYLASALIIRAEDLINLLRLATAISVIPCGLGITQYIMCTTLGYEAAMTFFYGEHAYAVTQRFAMTSLGTDLFRIPSTFSYVTQYSGYTLMMLAITYMHGNIEPHPSWRLFAKIMMGVVLVASLLSGARANFLFAPMLLLTILFLDAKLTRLVLWLVFGPIVIFGTLQAAGLDLFAVADKTSGLTSDYGANLVLPDLINSLVKYPLGLGVGTNTGGARSLMSTAELAALPHPIEGYYAKAIIELGIPGLLVLLLILFTLGVYSIRIHLNLRSAMARSCSAAIAAFIIIMAIHSFKGWQIDLDPINVWYWILVGIIFRLPELNFDATAEARRLADQEKQQRKTRRPQRRAGRAPHMSRYRQ